MIFMGWISCQEWECCSIMQLAARIHSEILFTKSPINSADEGEQVVYKIEWRQFWILKANSGISRSLFASRNSKCSGKIGLNRKDSKNTFTEVKVDYISASLIVIAIEWNNSEWTTMESDCWIVACKHSNVNESSKKEEIKSERILRQKWLLKLRSRRANISRVDTSNLPSIRRYDMIKIVVKWFTQKRTIFGFTR